MYVFVYGGGGVFFSKLLAELTGLEVFIISPYFFFSFRSHLQSQPDVKGIQSG